MKNKNDIIIQYPSKNIQEKVDCALDNYNNFTILIIGKFHRWLASKTLPFIINQDEEVSVFYTLFSAFFCMDLHQVIGSVNSFNQYNKTHKYKMVYRDEGSIIFTCC